MPKQVWKIDNFTGGLNNNSDPRDIADNEFADLDGVMIDEVGIIRPMGQFTTAQAGEIDTEANSHSLATTRAFEGSNLVVWSNDRLGGANNTTTGTYGVTRYAAILGATNGKLNIYEQTGETSGGDWHNDKIVINSDANPFTLFSYYVDGIIRLGAVYNQYHAGTNTQMLGYIKKGNNKVLGYSEATIGTWVRMNNAVEPDDSYAFRLLTGSSWSTSQSYSTLVGPSASSFSSVNAVGLNVTSNTGATTKTWNSYVSFYYSYVYNDDPKNREHLEQESMLKFIGNDTTGGYRSYRFYLWYWADTNRNKRISKINIYYRRRNASGLIYGPAYLLLEADLHSPYSITTPGTVESTSFVAETGTTPDTLTNHTGSGNGYIQIDNPPTAITYYDRNGWNGYKKEETDNDYQKVTNAKTSVVVNRKVYLGNVHIDGSLRGDLMVKSPVNKFDCFPEAKGIEAAINDGDDIVKLEEHADRILQFKKDNLYIINVSQDIEFLEEVFPHKGIEHTAHSCKTDFGIAWINTNGCYLYDGKQVLNLFEKKGEMVVSETYWQSFFSEYSSIGYYPKKRQIIIMKSFHTDATGEGLLFDIVTRSWVKSNELGFVDNYNRTNFVTDWNNNLLAAENSGSSSYTIRFKAWDDSSTSQVINITTKDYDFGQPSQRKKIYKVYLSYQGTGTNVTINYGVNGGALTGTFFRTAEDGSSTKATASNTCLFQGDVGSTDWTNAELRPSSSVNNIYSFQLKIAGNVTSDFLINDISILFRAKGLK